jgi:hypothetical protein
LSILGLSLIVLLFSKDTKKELLKYFILKVYLGLLFLFFTKKVILINERLLIVRGISQFSEYVSFVIIELKYSLKG